MIGVAVSLATVAFAAAHAAILVQFIGTTDHVLMWLTLIQVISLVCAVITLVVASRWLRPHIDGNMGERLWDQQIRFADNLKRWWDRLPAWLIFLCVLLIATVFLGEISILIARIQGNDLSWFHHVPTITVCVVCAVLCVAWRIRN